jgi:type II secretory pathway component PulM
VLGKKEAVMIRVPGFRLSTREKRILVLGSAFIALLIVIFGWVLPTLDRIKRLDRAIASERERLEEVRRLHGAIQEMSDREARAQEQLKKRVAEAFSIASVVEGMAREVQVMEQVQYLKPEQAKVSDQYRESSVSLKMGEITPEQLVDFLYRIESSDRFLKVRSLQIRTNPKEAKKLDVTLTVFTLLPAAAPVKSPEGEPPVTPGEEPPAVPPQPPGSPESPEAPESPAASS